MTLTKAQNTVAAQFRAGLISLEEANRTCRALDRITQSINGWRQKQALYAIWVS